MQDAMICSTLIEIYKNNETDSQDQLGGEWVPLTFLFPVWLRRTNLCCFLQLLASSIGIGGWVAKPSRLRQPDFKFLTKNISPMASSPEGANQRHVCCIQRQVHVSKESKGKQLHVNEFLVLGSVASKQVGWRWALLYIQIRSWASYRPITDYLDSYCMYVYHSQHQCAEATFGTVKGKGEKRRSGCW